jgi:hypothetical protein
MRTIHTGSYNKHLLNCIFFGCELWGFLFFIDADDGNTGTLFYFSSKRRMGTRMTRINGCQRINAANAACRGLWVRRLTQYFYLSWRRPPGLCLYVTCSYSLLARVFRRITCVYSRLQVCDRVAAINAKLISARFDLNYYQQCCYNRNDEVLEFRK